MTQQLHDRDPQLAQAIDLFVKRGLSHPPFAKTLLLAFAKGWSHDQVVRCLAAVSLPPGPIDWQELGHPSPERCKTLAAELLAVADTLQAGSLAPEAAPMACGGLPDLRVYALVHAPLAVSFADLVEVLGPASSAERLRWFAKTLQAVSMVN